MLSLPELISLESFAKRGAAPAIVTPFERCSFEELASGVAARMDELRARGICEGYSAVIVARHSLSTIINILALLHLGAFQIPVSPELQPSELEAIANRGSAGWILSGSEIIPAPSPHCPRSDGACLGLLSSGSTGAPKLVLRGADHVAAALQIYRAAVNLTSDDRVLALLPLEHSYGFHNVVLATLAAGATLFLHPTPHPRLALQSIRKYGITILPAAPIFFDLLVKFFGGSSQQLPLRAAISVGTALSRRIHEQFLQVFGLPIWQSYGTSESGPVALNKSGTPHGDFLALGEICPLVSVYIVGDDGHPCPEGETGEIIIDSPAVGIGYLSTNDGASRFVGRTFYTGDLGFIRSGELYFAGRRKTLIAAAGHKVDPLEIEQVLRDHPDVSDAAVLGVPDEDGIEQITAYVCAREGLSHAELLTHCAQRLAPYKVPRVIHFRASLPRNNMGKLLREQLL